MKKLWIALLLPLLPVYISAETLSPPPNLEDRIQQFQSQRTGAGPSPEKRAVMQNAADELAAAMPNPGLSVGTKAPDFTLTNAYGEQIRLYDQLNSGPVILTFYRGAWCPYCNLQLRALKESQPHFAAHDAQLIAITPQTPDKSLEQYKKDDFPFEILSDLDDQVMKAYNLYFEVPAELHNLYVDNFQLDITAYNGEGRMGLPVPGTFIIDQTGIIQSVFADTDYKKRMEPAAIIEALKQLKQQ